MREEEDLKLLSSCFTEFPNEWWGLLDNVKPDGMRHSTLLNAGVPINNVVIIRSSATKPLYQAMVAGAERREDSWAR